MHIRDTIKSEPFAGILLFLSALLALVLNNSHFYELYDSLLHIILAIQIGDWSIQKPIVLWINDGLMAVFFLFVGLEIKREFYKGVFTDVKAVVLPCVTATCGLIVPAIIYTVINHGDAMALKGWAIPVATDIAFSLGILSLLGNRVPASLKIFLTALAILDDILAILIIAIFYTRTLSLLSLIVSSLCILVLIALNQMQVMKKSLYIFVGVILWVSVLKSGIHATLAGIILAAAIPVEHKDRHRTSPLETMLKSLIPWVTFFVLPLFAFANAGFSFEGLSWSELTRGIPLGIIAGLFIGKQLGIFASGWITIKLKLAKLPKDITWAQFYGVALLCGVGFTMSLFIGGLAYPEDVKEYARLVRVGVLTGSALSGICGYLLLRILPVNKQTAQEP